MTPVIRVMQTLEVVIVIVILTIAIVMNTDTGLLNNKCFYGYKNEFRKFSRL